MLVLSKRLMIELVIRPILLFSNKPIGNSVLPLNNTAVHQIFCYCLIDCKHNPSHEGNIMS